MDTINLLGIFKTFDIFGVVGLVLILWYFDMRKTYRILEQYKKDMDETRQMYEKNVSLVKNYHSIASDLKDIVVLNIQQMTKVSDEIRQNEFCPLQRVNKKRVIKEA